MIRSFPLPDRTYRKAAISGVRREFGGRLPRAQEQTAKQLLELMIAIVAAIIRFPPLAMAGIALKRGVRGPVILRHERSG
jgi:lipopolysaccharide/colanic/teichoic acid biosynthesis glycosyltransferase